MTSVQLVTVNWRDRPVEIEYSWVGSDDPQAPVMLFLHEGLGSLALWKQFPAQLCESIGYRGLVYSRPGYGGSTPPAADECWQPDFMHQQAHDVLPALLSALALQPAAQPLWLVGHSDGGSIALLYAARHPTHVAGAILLAPHVFVEELTIASIEKAHHAWHATDLPEKLARYHQDADASFRCWSGIWLHPEFVQWNIEAETATVTTPLLAVQGFDDEYGTMAQIEAIARHVPQTELVKLENCRHSPHRDQPQAVIAACSDFVGGLDLRLRGNDDEQELG